MSIGVSKLGRLYLIFIDASEDQWCILSWGATDSKTVPVMREIRGKFFIVLQGNVPAHRACEAIKLMESETPAFILANFSSPNSTDLNPVDYKI